MYFCTVTLQQLSVLELQQLGSEVAYGCTLVQSPCNSCQCWSYNSWGQRWRRVVLLYSHPATAVSAGATTAGVRGGVGLYSCAVTMQQLSVLELQQLGSKLDGIGLCSCAASVITLVTVAAAAAAAAKSESWNAYMVNDHSPAFLEATNSTLNGCRFSVRHIKNFGDLPCCHWSAYMFSHPHPQCIIVVFPKRSEKAPPKGWNR